MLTDLTNQFNSPVRSIGARVELYEGSALADAYNQYYALKEFTIERIGEAKFFGFGICQKLNVHLVDINRNIYITTADNFKVYLNAGGENVSSFPTFYVTETHRDENTNELSVTAYDGIYAAAKHTIAELELNAPYTIEQFAAACVNLLNLSGLTLPGDTNNFGMSYEEGANFDGTETIREALTAIAEATQTIYYLDKDNKLVFKRLNMSGEADFTIDRNTYITLESGDNRRLGTITHTTELGDNVSVSTTEKGSTQYIRDNPFMDLREDIGTILEDALTAVGGLTINQFECEWRGNPLLEIGDKISLITKDNKEVYSYLLNDTIHFNGSLSQVSEWKYGDNELETESSSSNLGDVLKQTFAKVDKVNRQIDLVASETNANGEAIAALQVNTESINLSVQSIQDATTEALEGLNGDVANLTNKVNASITSEDVSIQIQSALENGVDNVTTATGFTFNEEGLTVSKSDEEMVTTITENGMTVYRNNEAVLIADNEGVKAEDLHATTYLIIGTNSRFEDYGTGRTGCFWIGGN